MGIRNRDGSLYMVTGIDNSGLYEGKREAMGIIKTLAGEITSFDVFGGIGISAATAFAKAAKSSYDFEKEFRKNMLEVATISTQVTDDMTGFMNQVMSITQEIPIKAPEAAKALYSIVSAGHDGADGMKILEVSAKAAVGGLTETETAADAITTILNAYKMSAEEAGTVSDQLFTTVRLGKTTFGELGASIAQVAPIAAAYGISIDQVLGAVASLTKQGTPTAQAMTQIRAAIQGTAGELGDAAFQGRTFQEALQLIYEKAGGSASKMKEMLGTDEGLAATLALTGKNAKAAASDLEELQSSLGATEAAFEKMKDEVGNQMTLLSNNIQAALRPMGEMILKEVSGIAKSFNEAFESGDLERSLTTLKSLLEVSAAAWGAYKVSVIAAMVAENLRYQSSLAHMQGMTKMQALLAVLKGKTDALTASLLKNPYALMAAAVAALGVALYKLWTYQTNAQKQQEKLNKTFSEFTVEAAKEERSLNSLFEALKRTNSGTEERKKMIKAVNDQYGQYLPKLLTVANT
nr:MAG TPA: minor tail protein [Caudoviricetes sp.]